MCPAARPGAGGPSVPGPRAAPAAAATACRRNSGNFRKKATGSPPFPRPFFRCGGCGRPPYTGTGAVIPSPIFSPLAGRERPPACRVVFHRPCSGGCCPVRSVRAPGLCCLALCRPGRCLATSCRHGASPCGALSPRAAPYEGAASGTLFPRGVPRRGHAVPSRLPSGTLPSRSRARAGSGRADTGRSVFGGKGKPASFPRRAFPDERGSLRHASCTGRAWPISPVYLKWIVKFVSIRPMPCRRAARPRPQPCRLALCRPGPWPPGRCRPDSGAA